MISTKLNGDLNPVSAAAMDLMSSYKPHPKGSQRDDVIVDRLNRARAGLVHVMQEALFDGTTNEDIYHWLDEVLTLVDMATIEVGASA